MTTLVMEFEKMTKHQHMLFKPKAKPAVAKSQTQEVQAGVDAKKQWVFQRIKQSKNNNTQIYKYIHTTMPPRKYAITSIHVQTRGREEEQPMTKDHR